MTFNHLVAAHSPTFKSLIGLFVFYKVFLIVFFSFIFQTTFNEAFSIRSININNDVSQGGVVVLDKSESNDFSIMLIIKE